MKFKDIFYALFATESPLTLSINSVRIWSFFGLLLIKLCSSIPANIPIAVIIDANQHEERQAFLMAVEMFNANVLAPRGSQYVPIVSTLDDSQSSFMVYRKTCSILEQAPVAIFGPFNKYGSIQLQAICEHYEVPHIEARLSVDFRSRTDLSINLYPHQSIISNVFRDIIIAMEWSQFVIIYEDSSNIIKLSDYLTDAQERSWEVRIFQLQPDQPYREILWQVKLTEIFNILLDLPTEHITEVLKQAQQVGILSEQHKYLITSFDLHTLELDDYLHSRTNITSLKIVQDQHQNVADWHLYSSNNKLESNFHLNQHYQSPLSKSTSAMIFDSINILTQALLELNDFKLIGSIDCNQQHNAWQYGTTIINYIRQVSTEGITGWIGFDESGFRSNLSFDIVTSAEYNFNKIGQWNNGVLLKKGKWKNWNLSNQEKMPLIKVTTLLNDPFVMNAKSSKKLEGNDRYEGFVVDMMMEISKILNIGFEINLVKDGAYGAMFNVSSNEWSGMIGEVLRGEADIAVADLTINSYREQAVDFTYPFMSTGISIIYKKPITKETSLWSFLSPFSTIVWICLLLAIMGISLVSFYVGRLTPYEWCDPHPCKHHVPILENHFNLANSFWCIIGSLMQQGSDVAPKALSTRVISAIWYFFTLIIVSSYTANLAAFLTIEKVPFPFENVEQLSQQTKVKYGCLKNGSTHKFFANSKIPLYSKMANFMEQNADVMVSSNAMGRKKVEKENGKYAFFMESATIEYITERYCNLTQVGGLLDSKGYGMATRKGSKLRAQLSEVILKLQETGVLQKLKDRWWKQKGGGQCIVTPSTLTELGLKNLGGVFVVLVVGSIFSLILCLIELLIYTRLSTRKSNTFQEDMAEELKFIISCYKSTKLLRRQSTT